MSGKSKCPMCQKEVVREYRPFCSKRCADVDLHRWLKGAYAIPCEDESASEMDLELEISRQVH